MGQIPSRLLLPAAVVLSCLSAQAAPVRLANDRVCFTLDPEHGLVVSGQDVRTGLTPFVGIAGCYSLGRPKTKDPFSLFDFRVLEESADVLVPGSASEKRTKDAQSFAARYTNPGLPEITLEKSYTLAAGAPYVAKRLAFLPARDLEQGLEYSIEVKLDPAFRERSYYHCPMGIHFGQRVPTYLRAEEIKGPLSLSGQSETQVGGGQTGMHAFVVCCNPQRNLSAVTYRYQVNDRFVRPAWLSYLGSGIVYDPRGWRMGVFSEYLSPDHKISAEVHFEIIPGDHLTAHRLWQQLPGWQALIHDPSVANDESPAWLERVKVAGMACEGINGPEILRQNYAALVNEGTQMVMVAGPGVTCWSGDGPIGTDYFEDGALYQKRDHRLVHDVAWFRRFIGSFRHVCPTAKFGSYFLSPEISTRISTRVGRMNDSWLSFYEGLKMPDDLPYITEQWRRVMQTHGDDYIYMDGAPEFGGVIDYEQKYAYQTYDALAIDRAVREAARSLGPDKMYWRNSEINCYTDCGFAELSGFASWAEMDRVTGWRNLSDRILKVKLYERPGKWDAPLYTSPSPECVNRVLGLGFRPWGLGPSAQVNAMYEVRNLRLLDADIRPCWWRDYGEVEAYALTHGSGRFLSATNHQEGAPVKVAVSADRRALGLPSDRPLYLWECQPLDSLGDLLSDFVVQDLWAKQHWARGVAIRRRLVEVRAAVGDRVGREVELPPNRLRQLVITPVPAIIYAANGYRRNYPLTDFCDTHLQGAADLGARQLKVTASIGQPAVEIALVAPAQWRFARVTVNGKDAAFTPVREEGAAIAVVSLRRGRYELRGFCEEASPAELALTSRTDATAMARFVPAPEGKGLYLGDRARLVYRDLGPWDLTRGSIEFAFAPDFADQGDTSHILFGAVGERANFHVYKLIKHDGLCFNIHAGDRDYAIVGSKARWTPGTWHRVKVAWDAQAGFEEMAFDGEPITHVDRALPDLSGWTGYIAFARHLNDTWVGTAAFSDLVMSAGDQAVFRCSFDGSTTDRASGRPGELANLIETGETLPFSFTLSAGTPLPQRCTPFWQLTREGAPVLTASLTGTRRGNEIAVTDARLTVPEGAEAGTYLLRAGVMEVNASEWPEIARFTVKAKPVSSSHATQIDEPLTAEFDAHPFTHRWAYTSFGAKDPDCRAAFDPATATFDLSIGTAFDQTGAVAAGVELTGLDRLALEFLVTDDVRQPRPAMPMRMARGPNTLGGVTVDFHTPAGYPRRVVFGLDSLTQRTTLFPNWAWGAEVQRQPLALVDLTEGGQIGVPRRLAIDLKRLAPDGWDGRIVVSGVLQECLLTTKAKVRLLPAREGDALSLTEVQVLDTNAQVQAARLDWAPVIDGVLEDRWLKLKPLAPFYDLGYITRAKQQSRAYVAHDGQALYVAVDCTDTETLGSETGQRDAPVWQDDDVEVFVRPAGSAEYYQFGLSAVGGRFEARGKSAAYNAEWQGKSATHPGAWSAELRIPFAAVEQGPPASGAVWRLAICRANHNSGFGELSAWPVFRARDFHSSESYAPVTFE